MAAAKLTQEEIISRIDEIPTLPTIVYELSKVINDPMSSTADVEKIMANDQSLTSKVLQMVNSAYYAIPGGVTTLARAIAYIGFDTINQLVLSASILKTMAKKGPQKFDLNEFWKHSVGVAAAAETIAKHVKHPTPFDLFTCGLVHDLGKVALYSIEPDLVVEITDRAVAENKSYFEIEEALGVPDHTKIGEILAKRWNLPPVIQAAIKYHHYREIEFRAGITPEHNQNVDIVYLANVLTHAFKFGKAGHDRIQGAPKDILERLNLDPEKDLKGILLEIKGSLAKAQDFLKVLGDNA